MENILEIKNLNISFNIDNKNCECIKNLSLDFEKNKFHALVGESGCGKSILASSIIGLLPKSAKINSGEIIFEGENVFNFTENKKRNLRGRKIAYIPQDPMTSLNPLYTIENQLMEVVNSDKNLEPLSAKEKIIECLKAVKINEPENRLKSYPHELSGGMRQRVIIAMALLTDARLIIADEPTTALDVTIQAQILDILKDIQSLGKTVILITHDLGIVYKYADFASVMYLGEIFEKNSAKNLIKNPIHPYTKALLEAIPSSNSKKLKNINGHPSPITEKIEGCSFHNRCEFVQDICKKNHPELCEKTNVRCHIKN